jgi:RimJ/RimL family protein N-acetyltransferase
VTELETERLRLRAWRDDDAPHLDRLYANPDFMRYLAARGDGSAAVAGYRAHWAEHGFGIWAAEEKASGAFVGRIGVAYHRLWPDEPEVGWSLDPAFWGRGYATEGGAASLRHAFGTLGFDRLVSIVLRENVRSIRVMDRLGIRPYREVWWPEGEAMLEVRAIARAEWARRARLQSSE